MIWIFKKSKTLVLTFINTMTFGDGALRGQGARRRQGRDIFDEVQLHLGKILDLAFLESAYGLFIFFFLNCLGH